jgi:hypothetical protein
MLFHITPSDPATYTAVSGGLIALVLAAACRPAWHASRIDAMSTLRSE